MDKELVKIMEWLINEANEKQINALYEFAINKDIDFIKDLLGKELFNWLLEKNGDK